MIPNGCCRKYMGPLAPGMSCGLQHWSLGELLALTLWQAGCGAKDFACYVAQSCRRANDTLPRKNKSFGISTSELVFGEVLLLELNLTLTRVIFRLRLRDMHANGVAMKRQINLVKGRTCY